MNSGLFSGLACFSPSVPVALRRLWVKNGGRLTHTDADFSNAGFFFCNGMDDPWFKQLRSRSLIVRHAAWVGLCATEQFVMPIADYTLDDRFDESSIDIRGPPAVAQLANSKSEQVTGKRPFDHEDTYRSYLERPNKRARVEDEVESTIDSKMKSSAGQDKKVISSDEPAEKQVVKDVDHPVLCDAPKRVGILPQNFNISQRVKKFESLIQPKRHSPRTLDIKGKGVPRSGLDPHAIFWNNLFSRSYTRNQDCRNKLTLKIEELIDAPGVKAGIFTVNETYLGEKFINKDYEQ